MLSIYCNHLLAGFIDNGAGVGLIRRSFNVEHVEGVVSRA